MYTIYMNLLGVSKARRFTVYSYTSNNITVEVNIILDSNKFIFYITIFEMFFL